MSFITKLTLLSRATSDDAEPTPGYMCPEINKMSFESIACCRELVDCLTERLTKRSCHVKLKVLRIMKYLVTNGHPQFRQNLRQKSHVIVEAEKHSGPPDPLHGSAPYLAVRQEAKELSRLLFTIIDDEPDVLQPFSSNAAPATGHGLGPSATGMVMQGFGNTTSMHGFGNTASMQGFGNIASMRGFGSTAATSSTSKSIGDTIRDGLQDIAEKAANMVLATDARQDVTFAVPSRVGSFPAYKPVEVPFADDVDTRVTKPQPQIVTKRTAPTRRPGVAGGGWDDGDEDCDELTRCESSARHTPSSGSCSDRNLDVSRSEDWSAESRLVEGFIADSDGRGTFPRHAELNDFITRCSDVSCEKVVELLCAAMDASSTIPTLRALLVIESLLRTDLVTPDHITVTCCHRLKTLYASESVDNAVRQKSRKVIRILEKLSPSQANLFSDLPSSDDGPSEIFTSDTVCNDRTLLVDEAAISMDNNFSSALPFLMKT